MNVQKETKKHYFDISKENGLVNLEAVKYQKCCCYLSEAEMRKTELY